MDRGLSLTTSAEARPTASSSSDAPASTTLLRASLPSLPAELKLQIIESLDDQASIIALWSVDRELHRLATSARWRNVLSISHTLTNLRSLSEVIVPEHGKDMDVLALEYWPRPIPDLTTYEDEERHAIFIDLLHSLPRVAHLEISPLPLEPSLLSVAAAQSFRLTSLVLLGQESSPLDPRDVITLLRDSKQLVRLVLNDIASADGDRDVMSSVVAAVHGLENLRHINFAFTPHAFVEGLNPAAPLAHIFLVDIPDVGSLDFADLLRTYQRTLEDVDFKPNEFDLQPLASDVPIALPSLHSLSITHDYTSVFAHLQTPALRTLNYLSMDASLDPQTLTQALEAHPRPALRSLIVDIEPVSDEWEEVLAEFTEPRGIKVKFAQQ